MSTPTPPGDDRFDPNRPQDIPRYGQQPGQPGQYGQPGYGQQPPGAYGQYPGQPGGYGAQNNTPMVLSVIGIVCWWCCPPTSIALGLIAQGKFREQSRADTMAKVAWIGGIVASVLGTLSFSLRWINT